MTNGGSYVVCAWWCWIVLGVALIGVELLFPSFTIVWFGFGALMVGGGSLLWGGDSLLIQALVWILISICCSLCWRRYLRRRSNQEGSRDPSLPPFEGCSSVTDLAVQVVSRQGHLLRVVTLASEANKRLNVLTTK